MADLECKDGYYSFRPARAVRAALPLATTSHMASLLGATDCLDQTAVIQSERDWTWREIHRAALALAPRLPEGHAVCNLCSSYLAFLITWVATLRRNLTLVLPPSRGAADLHRVISLTNQPVLLITDNDVRTDINTPWLHCLPCSLAQQIQPDTRLSWETNLDEARITLYTSGSTGAPEPRSRSLAQLFAGALQLGSRLGQTLTRSPSENLEAFDHIVSSVPPQHMFGIETMLMLSITFNKPVIDRRPLLPADIQDAMTYRHGKAAWIATPLHLQALSRAAVKLESCSVALTSTMPLSREIAQKTETLIKGPVIEIYGSTETGALATRRTATTSVWTQLDSVGLDFNAEYSRASGQHFDSPQVISDQLEPMNTRQFKLIGRNSDVIKIGGRRTSLAALNTILQEIDGIDDAAFIATNRDARERPVLIYSKTSTITPVQIKSALKARIDPVFLPRVLICVDRIPRNERGKVIYADLMAIYQQWQSEKSKS